MACFTHPSPVWRLRSGEPLEFLDETYPAKTKGTGLLYGENFNRFWLIHPRDRRGDARTDKRATAYSMLSIYAICCRTLKTESNIIPHW